MWRLWNALIEAEDVLEVMGKTLDIVKLAENRIWKFWNTKKAVGDMHSGDKSFGIMKPSE